MDHSALNYQDHSAAVLPYSALLALSSPFSRHAQMLGMLKYNEGKYSEAVGFFEKSLQQAEECHGLDIPDKHRTLEPLAMSYAALGECEKLEGLFEKYEIHATAKYKIAAIEQLLSTYLRSQRVDIFPDVLSRYLSLIPSISKGTDNFFYKYGLLCANTERFEDAKRLFAPGVATFDGKKECLAKIIEICQKKGKILQVVWFLKIRIEFERGSEPKESHSWLLLSQIYLGANNLEGAYQAGRRAVAGLLDVQREAESCDRALWHLVKICQLRGNQQDEEIYVSMLSARATSPARMFTPSLSTDFLEFELKKLENMEQGRAAALLGTEIFPELSNLEISVTPGPEEIKTTWYNPRA